MTLTPRSNRHLQRERTANPPHWVVSFEKPPGSSQGITIDSRVSWAYNGHGRLTRAKLEGRNFLPALQIAKSRIVTPKMINADVDVRGDL